MAPIIKKEHVSIAAPGQSVPRRRPGHAKAAILLRVDGEVRAIEVSCSCGEKMVVELDYEQMAAVAPAAAAPAAPAVPAIESSPPIEDESSNETESNEEELS